MTYTVTVNGTEATIDKPNATAAIAILCARLHIGYHLPVEEVRPGVWAASTTDGATIVARPRRTA